MMMTDFRFDTLIGKSASALKVLTLSVSVIATQHVASVVLAAYSNSAVPVSGVAFAQEQEGESSKPKTRVTQAMSNKVYEKVQAAQKAAEDKNIKEAIKILDELKNSKRLNDAELATVMNIYGFIYFQEENYAKAQESYAQILKLPKASAGTVLQARYSLAQAYFIDEKYAEGVATLKEWFKESETRPASAYVLMAQGMHQLKDYDGALENINIAIQDYKDKAKTPPENWYGLQSFLYYEKGNYKKVVEILQEMLKYYPSKKYWIQLSAMYAELKSEQKQLAALDTAYVQNMLDREQELVNVASLFLTNDAPYKAAKVLDKAIKEKKVEATSKNLDLLGIAWRSAQELDKAIPVMEQAAAKSDKGDLWAQLCGVYLDNDQYKKAVESCAKGINKGSLKREDTAYLRKGMGHFYLEQYDEARKAFKQAAKDKRSKKFADDWIKYMDSELERLRSLEQV